MAQPRRTGMATKGGLDRDEGTLMLALLVGQADGVADPDEERAIVERLAPHLQRLGPGGQARAVEVLADLMDRFGLERTLTSIRAAFPFHAAAVDAFRLAVDVAFADGMVTSEEVERVADLARGLQLTEDELRSCLPGGKAKKKR